MKIKRILSAFLALGVGFISTSFGIIAEENPVISVKTKPEAIQAKFNLIDGVSNYSAYIKNSSDNSYKKLDDELVRKGTNDITVNAVGLASGNYSLYICDKNNTNNRIEITDINVLRDDRSGYAHFNNTTGIGAYNNDGTLKSNAIVVYVNDNNKNTVKATVNGEERTGLVNIIKAAKNANEALDVRIIGTIKTKQWNYKTRNSTVLTSVPNEDGKYFADVLIENGVNTYEESEGITLLNDLTSYCTTSDSYWNMCDIKDASNVTVEGIGEDSGLYQWGLTFSKCNSIEVKNLTFTNYTEDAIGIQGNNNDSVANYKDYWIHNCTFEKGKNNWDMSSDNDKGEGDGSTDFKYAHNLTISYCKYNETHKSNLIGSNNASLQYNITLHHNYYLNCTSRLPLVRQSNIHIYNNYYKGTVSTGISVRAKSFTFIENCYFDAKNPFMLAYKVKDSVDPIGTTIKAIGNEFSNNVTTSKLGSNADQGFALADNGIYVLTSTTESLDSFTSDLTASRTTKSSGSVCTPDGITNYVNFDTNSSLFYYDSEKFKSDVSRMDNASSLPSLLPTISGSIFNTVTYSLGEEFVYNNTLLDLDFNNTEIISQSTGVANKINYWTNVSGTTNNYVVVNNNNKLHIVDNSAGTTNAQYTFSDSNEYNSGTIKYLIDVTIPKAGSWSFLTFNTSTNNIVIGTDSNKKLTYTCGSNSGTIINAEMVDNKSYEIILTINYTTSTANVVINGNKSSDFTFNGSINSVSFKTANDALRSFYVNNIKILEEEKLNAEYDFNIGYQKGNYSKNDTNYVAYRLIGKIDYNSSLISSLDDIKSITIRFNIYSGDTFKNSIVVNVNKVYDSLINNNSVIAAAESGIEYYYAVINGITSSHNGFKIKAETAIQLNDGKIIVDNLEWTIES